MSLEQLNLRKEKVLDLKKQVGLEGKKAQVVLALDFSGSMEGMYRSGKVQEIVERLLPLGLAFDDNGEVDLYLFETNAHKVPISITQDNYSGFIDREVMDNYEFHGTNYAPCLQMIFDDKFKTGGFLGFGKKTRSSVEDPVYVIFITDGDSMDHGDTNNVMRKISDKAMFVQFIGIGHEGFPYLDKLDNLSGRTLDNANYFSVRNIDAMSDDELYGKLFTEFPGYIAQAKAKGFIS